MRAPRSVNRESRDGAGLPSVLFLDSFRPRCLIGILARLQPTDDNAALAAEQRDVGQAMGKPEGGKRTRPAARVAAALSALAGAAGYSAAILAALTLATMVALVFANIVLRNFGAGGLDYTTEVAGYCVAAITWGALAWALREGIAIRVSLLCGLMQRHPKLDLIMHGLALLCTLAVTAVAARYFWLSVARHWHRGTLSPTTAEVPMWLPEAVMLAGLLLVLLQVTAMLASVLAGHRAGVGETLGARADLADRAES